MSFEFKYRGGIRKPEFQQTEKFLLFFVIGGKEIPFYQILQDSLAEKKSEKDSHVYITGNNVVKLFVSEQGFGIPKRYHSFYMRLLDGVSPKVTIKPFSLSEKFYFEGQLTFLKKSQVLNILDDRANSLKFLKRQQVLPLKTLTRIITVDKVSAKRGMRHVRLNRKKTKGRC